MISLLRGKVASKQAGNIVIDVGGVGYEVTIPIDTYTKAGEAGAEVKLHIYTHVRENTLALYGFAQRPDKDLFVRLLDVSGIGPRLAMALLSRLSASELAGAIRAGEYKPLVRAPGVGKKTAQRIVLELKEKLESFGAADDVLDPEAQAVEGEVVSALANLGCSVEAAKRAVTKVRGKSDATDFAALFRAALNAIKR